MKRLMGAAALLSTGFVLAAVGAGMNPALATDAEIVGLDRYTVESTSFSVKVREGVDVCRMVFNGQERLEPPWTFIYDPATPPADASVTVELCDGDDVQVAVNTSSPFAVRSLITTNDDAVTDEVVIQNNLDEEADAVVYLPGGTERTYVVPPFGSVVAEAPAVSGTTKLPVSIRGKGVSVDSAITVAKGWATFGAFEAPLYAPCSEVTWAYDPAGTPKDAKTFKLDIEPAFERVSEHTGLTFRRIDDYDKADIRIHWGKLDKGISGWGSTDGEITFSTDTHWPKDVNRGFGRPQLPKKGTGGRGWLIVHEILHTLGFDHNDDVDSVMFPRNNGQHAFTEGDIEGMRHMYLDRCDFNFPEAR